MIILVPRPPVSRSRTHEAGFRKDMVSCLISEKDKIPHFHTLGDCDFDVHFHVPDEKFVLGIDNRNAEPTLEVARDALVKGGVVTSRFTTFRFMDVVRHSVIAPAVVFEVASPCSCCGIYIGLNHIETFMHFVGEQCICGYCNQNLNKFGFLNLRRTKERLFPDGRVVPLSALVLPGATVFDEDEDEEPEKPKPKHKEVKIPAGKPILAMNKKEGQEFFEAVLEKEVEDFYGELLKLVNLLAERIRIKSTGYNITKGELLLAIALEVERSQVK